MGCICMFSLRKKKTRSRIGPTVHFAIECTDTWPVLIATLPAIFFHCKSCLQQLGMRC
uniref:Uncharacterized protein n=1 Tax=Anguilla anguilla TaxID=7936 RepID=A0A0E9U904_ANGAN